MVPGVVGTANFTDVGLCEHLLPEAAALEIDVLGLGLVLNPVLEWLDGVAGLIVHVDVLLLTLFLFSDDFHIRLFCGVTFRLPAPRRITHLTFKYLHVVEIVD